MKLVKNFIIATLILVSVRLHAQTYIAATGGAVTTQGNYKIHTFTSSGTFNVSSGSGTIEVLVVGGGGSGGGSTGGGGGAGGLVYNSAYTVTSQNYTVTVGAGGAKPSQQTIGNNGENSVFGTLIAYGGGGGGYTGGGGAAGLPGGSGGGGSMYEGNGSYTYGTGTAGQGNNGGTYGTNVYPGGGGGGAGAAGSAPTSNQSGNGGIGLAYSISGSSVFYAGGGGGGSSALGGNGGDGGGGGGQTNSISAADGTPNRGGGGGGGYYYSGGMPGAGGSGIVIIKYQYQGTATTGGGTPGQWNTSGNNIYYDAGVVGIGTGATYMGGTDYKLFVAKGIRTEKLKVDVPYTAWPDYVFDKNYKLPSLGQIKKFIQLNQHLPGIPSAKEVEKNGIDVGMNQALLLQKIEELTLFLIKQDEKIEKQNKKIDNLQKQIKQLRK